MLFSLSRGVIRPLQGNILRQRYNVRAASSKVHQLPRPGHNPSDFRPPWFYTLVQSLSWLVVPGITFYAVFFYDFGDHEHVFQEPRRWAARKKAEFLTLSPEEKTLIGDKITEETKQ